MKTSLFFTNYLPALKAALDNDDNNIGFQVFGPDYYFPINILHDMDNFIENNKEFAGFFDRVGCYFDAKSHYYDNVLGIDIGEYKERIKNDIKFLSDKFNTKSDDI